MAKQFRPSIKPGNITERLKRNLDNLNSISNITEVSKEKVYNIDLTG